MFCPYKSPDAIQAWEAAELQHQRTKAIEKQGTRFFWKLMAGVLVSGGIAIGSPSLKTEPAKTAGTAAGLFAMAALTVVGYRRIPAIAEQRRFSETMESNFMEFAYSAEEKAKRIAFLNSPGRAEKGYGVYAPTPADNPGF